MRIMYEVYMKELLVKVEHLRRVLYLMLCSRGLHVLEAEAISSSSEGRVGSLLCL